MVADMALLTVATAATTKNGMNPRLSQTWGPDRKRRRTRRACPHGPASGAARLEHWALPNVFFHVTTACALLRHNGVDLCKGDYLLGHFSKPALTAT